MACVLCPTRLLYLRDSVTLCASAKLQQLRRAGAPATSGVALVLDQSHFYPQGGGQPSDTGTIAASGWRVHVDSVRLDAATAAVVHEGRLEAAGTVEDVVAETRLPLEVQCAVDGPTRRLHSALHSAGHLIDIVLMDVLGCADTLSVSKAYHFPQGPSVEYRGDLGTGRYAVATAQERQAFAGLVESHCNALIGRDLRVDISVDAKEALGEDGTPNDQATRWMSIETFGRKIPCGGTHVQSLGEIGRVTIRKLEIKAGAGSVKVGYQVHLPPHHL